jgi:hypothetical protein
MRAAVAPRELTRRGRRRDLGDRTQLGARLVGAQPLEIEHRVTTAQQRFRDSDQQLPGRAAARTLLDRPQPADLRRRLDRTVQRRDQLQPPDELTDDHRPTERRQRRIVGDHLNPRRLPEPIAPRLPPRAPRTLGLRLHRQGALPDRLQTPRATHAAKRPGQTRASTTKTAYSGIKVRRRAAGGLTWGAQIGHSASNVPVSTNKPSLVRARSSQPVGGSLGAMRSAAISRASGLSADQSSA